MRLYPKPETRLDSLAVLRGQRFVGQQDGSRLQQFLASNQPGHGIAEPSNQTVAGQHDGIVHRLGKAGRARGQLLPKLGARVWIRGGRIGFQAGGGENLETANIRPIGDRRRRRDGEPVVALRRFGINHRGPFSTSPRKSRSSSNGPCPSARARFWRRSSLPDQTGSANGALRAYRIVGHGAGGRGPPPPRGGFFFGG